MKSSTLNAHWIFRLLITVMLMHSTASSIAQPTSGLRISLLTCSPGKELYSTFGHSAIRIIDSARSGDWVFNYGTFDFSDPDFYSKFVQGKLLYFVSMESTPDFIAQYQYEKRKVVEQELGLSEAEKIYLQQLLLQNLKPENRFYQYDFFFDNCTTRLRDLLEHSKQPQPDLPAVMPVNTRFREAIHAYLEQGNQHWSKLGIDLLLGARTDRVMRISEQQFLPDNLMFALDRCTNHSMIRQTRILYEPTNKQSEDTPIQPMHASLMLVGLLGGLAWFEQKNRVVKTTMIFLDGILFFAVGLLGVVLTFAWFGTDHIMTKSNYNLLWALPSLCLIPFFATSQKTAFKRFMQGHMLLLVLTLLMWFWLPQQLNVALIPLVAWMTIRLYRKAPLHATHD
jgi:hypothetical protein